MLRILNVEPNQYSYEARSILKKLGILVEKSMGRDELLKEIGGYNILIARLGHQIDRELLEAARQLKVIVTATTGLDHIDLKAAAQRDIQVLSLRGEVDFLQSIPATAEHTWGLLLALTRNIPWAYTSVLTGEWQRDHFIGHDLCGKRLGILGLGRIGEKMANFGLAFGMQVRAYDPYRKKFPENVSLKESLNSLLRDSDILTIHVPLNPETEKIISTKEIESLPKSAYLINTSRGDVLDEVSLFKALASGHLAGAALDVISNERQFKETDYSRLISYAQTHSNLLITPHLGGATHESMRATEVFMANKLKQNLEKTGWL